MYSEVFCKVYDAFGWNYYPEIFGQQLLVWRRERQLSPGSALDLACGTGVLCRLLRDQGMEVWGMDLSRGMIGIARKNDPVGHYDVADMITYRPGRTFDLVTCTGDAVNHIPALSDVAKIFRNVCDALAPGGWFVFDLLDEGEVSDSEPFEMDFTDTVKVWFQMTRPTPRSVDLCVRVFEQGELALEEHIRETLHDPAIICDLLRDAGFRVDKCAHRLPDSGERDGTTWFLAAQKPLDGSVEDI